VQASVQAGVQATVQGGLSLQAHGRRCRWQLVSQPSIWSGRAPSRPPARLLWIVLVVLVVITAERIHQSLGEGGILGDVLILLSALLPARGVPRHVETCFWITHGTERTTRR